MPSISSNDEPHLCYFAIYFIFGSHPCHKRNGLPENFATDGSPQDKKPKSCETQKGLKNDNDGGDRAQSRS